MLHNKDGKGLTKDAKIMRELMSELNTTPSFFSKKIGYKSNTSFYNILNGKTKITEKLIERVLNLYPSVNELFLRKGEKPIVLGESLRINQQNINHNFDTFQVMSLLYEIMNTQKKTNELLENLLGEKEYQEKK